MRLLKPLCLLLLILGAPRAAVTQPLTQDFFGAMGFPYQGQHAWLNTTLNGLHAGGIRSVRFPIHRAYRPQGTPDYSYTVLETDLVANGGAGARNGRLRLSSASDTTPISGPRRRSTPPSNMELGSLRAG